MDSPSHKDILMDARQRVKANNLLSPSRMGELGVGKASPREDGSRLPQRAELEEISGESLSLHIRV